MSKRRRIAEALLTVATFGLALGLLLAMAFMPDNRKHSR